MTNSSYRAFDLLLHLSWGVGLKKDTTVMSCGVSLFHTLSTMKTMALFDF